MPREVRKGRSRGGFGGPPKRTQRSRLFPRETPTFQSGRAGLEGVSTALNNFFNKTQSVIQTVQDAAIANDKAKIKRENQEQRLEAFIKAEIGEPLTEEEMKDLDYVQTYSKTVGINSGAELANEYEEIVASLPLDTDIDEFTEQFLRENLKNGETFGTGDPILDASMLDTFKRKTYKSRQNFRQATIKNQLWEGRRKQQSSIAERVMEIDGADIPQLIEDAKALRPMSPWEGPGDVLNSLLVGAGTDPVKIAHLFGEKGVLRQPGSGVNGKSFAESYPEAFREHEAAAVQSWQSGKTWEGSLLYDEVRRVIDETDDMGQLIQLGARGGVLDQIAGQHGKGGQYNSLRSKLVTKITKKAKEVIELNQVEQMRRGQLPLDVGLARKHLRTLFEKHGIEDPHENPEDAAHIVNDLGNVISDDIKADLSSSLVNLSENNAERFTAAMEFYASLEEMTNEEMVLDLMDDSAAANYLHAKSFMQFTNRPVSEILKELQSNRAEFEKAEKTSWKQITGGSRTIADAEQKVSEEITDVLSDVIGQDVMVPDATMDDLMTHAKMIHMSRARLGDADWEDSIRDAMKIAHKRLHVFPGENGELIAEHTLIPDMIEATDEYGVPIIDESGRIKKEPVVKFGRAVNPETGDIEDTSETAREDAELLVGMLDGLELGGVPVEDADDISFDHRSPFAMLGTWIVKNNGDPIVFGTGQTYEIGGKTIEIPSSREEAVEFFANIKLPFDEDDPVSSTANKRFRFIELSSGLFMLGYRPGFVNRLPTLEELEERFEPEPDRPRLSKGVKKRIKRLREMSKPEAQQETEKLLEQQRERRAE